MIDRAGRIYREQRVFMFNVAFGHLHTCEDAEDAVQQAAFILLRQRTEPTDERGLAWTAAHQAAHAILTRRKWEMARFKPVDMANPAHHPLVESAEQMALLWETVWCRLRGEPEEMRVCAAPRCDLPVPEGGRSSDRLYCSGACRWRAYRARKLEAGLCPAGSEGRRDENGVRAGVPVRRRRGRWRTVRLHLAER